MNFVSYIKNPAKIVSALRTQCDALLSPPYCQYCLQIMPERDIFCSSCYLLIRPIPSTQLAINSGSQVIVHAISRYSEPIKSLILAKAYANYLASIYLAQLIWRLTPLKNSEFDYLVPVPLHWTRSLKRGYNQAEIMAQELSKLSGKPVLSALARTRRTPFQSKFSQKDREKNVQHAFRLAIPEELFQDKTVVLVDDLCTAGSTLKNCAKLFTRSKPRKIIAVVGARV